MVRGVVLALVPAAEYTGHEFQWWVEVVGQWDGAEAVAAGQAAVEGGAGDLAGGERHPCPSRESRRPRP